MKAALRWIRSLALLAAALGTTAHAETRWQEEVLLHDGSKIIVTRVAERGGRHEIGQEPPIREQNLSFTMPGTTRSVTWEDRYSADVGGANFNLKLLDISHGTAYVMGMAAGCLSYNKWGRPNPPYVIFAYDGEKWQRVPLEALPAEIKTPNLIPSSPDHEAKKAGEGVIPAEKIRALYEGYRQPEYKTILREPLPKRRIDGMCEELILYKGSWIMPNDPVARRMLDRDTK